MTAIEPDTKAFVLAQRKEGRLVYMGIAGLVSVNIDAFITQPADGILYDLNRLEEVVLTFIDDPKWVNDFAVALTIRELHATLAATQAKLADCQQAYLRLEAYCAALHRCFPKDGFRSVRGIIPRDRARQSLADWQRERLEGGQR